MAEGMSSSEMVSLGKLPQDEFQPQALILLIARRSQLSLPEISNQLSSPILKWSVRHVSNNFANNIGVHEMAQSVGLSKFHFIRKFREEAGITPGVFLQRFRMVRAIELLVSSDHAIGDIAHEVGYQDTASFSRAFLRIMGTQPRLYRLTRRQNRQNKEKETATDAQVPL